MIREQANAGLARAKTVEDGQAPMGGNPNKANIEIPLTFSTQNLAHLPRRAE